MADGTPSKVNAPGARGLGADHTLPPPSTLAAQLVENLSPSAKSSRSDENRELKSLFAIIQQVKDNPELLRSHAERVEHNHMLIYVYSRVVLDNIKPDDPFLDASHICTEALRAINFLRFTIKETPSVLAYTGQHGFVFRGREPLWIWLLPRLLRILGHTKLHRLDDSIEGFLQYLMLVVARNGILWEVAPQLSSYLRAIVIGLLGKLEALSLRSSSLDVLLNASFPPELTLNQILGEAWSYTNHGTSYHIQKASQASRQLWSLVKVMSYSMVSRSREFSSFVPWTENGPWILDVLLELFPITKRWDQANSSHTFSIIELILEIINNLSGDSRSFKDLRTKAYTILILTCADLLAHPEDLLDTERLEQNAKFLYCKSLILIAHASQVDRVVGRLAESKLVNELALLSSQHPDVGEGTDLAKCADILGQQVRVSGLRDGQEQDMQQPDFQNTALGALVEKLHLQARTIGGTRDGAKRVKLTKHQTTTSVAIIHRIADTLRIELNSDGLMGLQQPFLDAFSQIDEPSQCLAIDLLSQLRCVREDLNSPDSPADCSLCNGGCQGTSSTGSQTRTSDPDEEIIWDIFQRLTRLESFLESKRPRIATMIALRRLVLHCRTAERLDLETSTLAQWCIQSLNSSLRELRIAAGRTLVAFILPADSSALPLSSDLVERNRQNSIALLKSASEQRRPYLIETCIMAWGQLGRVAKEDELNLILIQLLEYLGDSNNVVSAFAFNELVKLAESRATTPRRLFEPYWRSLAYLATKDMVQRPQRSRAVAELLQISVNELLVLIQTHALPWLVLYKRKDIIQKIAEARQERELWPVLIDDMNLGAILSILLVQETPDVIGFAKSRLDDISPHFHSNSLLSLLQSEPVIIAMELLMAAGDADLERKPLAIKALQTVASLMLSSSKDSKSKKDHAARFLQGYLLGLMARFTDVINDSVSPDPPVIEQRRCIRALTEMIQICQANARIARPQISACLLSAMPQEALREAAFNCWASMLFNLEEEDVEALLETTFFIVQHYWSTLTSSAAQSVKHMVEYLLAKYKEVLTHYINKLPTLSGLKGLEDIEHKLNRMRPNLDTTSALITFSQRITHDHSGVVHQALLDLVRYLRDHKNSIAMSTLNQRSDSIIATLLRALLDCVCKYNGNQVDIARLCVECIGLIGCHDSNQIETFRDQPSLVILNNFTRAEEVTDFSLFILEAVLVPAFLSATDTKLQGFLSFAMQELLDRSEVKAACATHGSERLEGAEIYRKWIAMPEQVREVLTPFLSSRYMIAPMAPTTTSYPIFRPGKPYGSWLRQFVVDLLRKGQNPHAQLIFEPLTRVIRVKDLSAAEFLLPYLVLHILLSDENNQAQKEEVLEELKLILRHEPADGASYGEREDLARFCHSVFRVIDYAMRWIQSKRSAGKLTYLDKEHLVAVQQALDTIPAPLISQRAIDCNEYARALFHLEHYAQNLEQSKREPGERTLLLEKLQDIYANIDEPDGLEGISAHLPALDINQQILSYKKAGKWSAVQTWYEMQLAEKPDNLDIQLDLLNCLKQAGQHDVLLNHVEGMHTNPSNEHKLIPFAVEAAWVTSRWEVLAKLTTRIAGNMSQDFNVSIAVLLDALRKNQDSKGIEDTIREMRQSIASSMNTSSTASLQAAHEHLLRCHVLTDLEMIIESQPQSEEGRRKTMGILDNRLHVVGAYFNDKQYLLGIRRAAMELMRPAFSPFDISSLWLSSSRLARKSNMLHQSFNAVLHASQLGDDAATIENAKLLWRDNHQHTAIQMLQGAIERNKLMTQTGAATSTSTAGGTSLNHQQKLLTARAQLLLAKWLDAAGQTHTTALRERYQQPPKTYPSWEKGHYYLGRYYKKLLESEKHLKSDDQSDNHVTGEIARLVIENYVRSLHNGTKYLYQTLPRILTLWLDMGAQVDKPPEGKASLSRELHRRRLEQLSLLHSFLDKYISRLPAFIFYTALPQIVARIAHPNLNVFERLCRIIVKVVEAHPRQALWSLIGIMTSKQATDRKARGAQILQTLRSVSRKVEGESYDLKSLLRMGEKLAEQLLLACQNGEFHSNKTVHASLTRDLRFNHKSTPCPLAVPVEASLTATLPAVTELVKKHKAFSQDVVSIDSFLDDVLVLSSLAKPRRLTARGSDGKNYMLLIKPKDDLRTDQRLMEFNGMINRSLKRDAESSRRQLYIRTYAVVPLNEECGIIEWVPGIKTIRDILLNLYMSRKIYPDYVTLKQLMEEASLSESKIRIFTDDVLGRFPPVLHLWFIQQFPSPSGWFAARLRYTRSCAVMSMVGTILGLGDRHGENVNLEEGNGGIFHVDFNCLFDKGLTFAKPERVPFRLTHNMVTAMGIYGYEGPFRKSSELTLGILRQQEETLMTILESFIYDPTLDLQKEKRSSKKGDGGVKLQPQAVVESIKRKVRGLLPQESIPLGVEGQVEELIKQAVDPRNLTAMYIGWCPFL